MNDNLSKWEKLYGVVPISKDHGLRFQNVIDTALQQIKEKGYAKPFAGDPRKLFKIGVSFSTQTRRIEEWKVVG